MKNNNKTITEIIQTNASKSISDRLDKMENMLLYGIDKMEIIDKKLDNFINNINIRMVGQVYTSTEEETWYDELKRTMKWKKK